MKTVFILRCAESFLLLAVMYGTASTSWLKGVQKMAELKSCPVCGYPPRIEYACGEYFIVGRVKDCPVCDDFYEMHTSESIEIEAWNRRAEDV